MFIEKLNVLMCDPGSGRMYSKHYMFYKYLMLLASKKGNFTTQISPVIHPNMFAIPFSFHKEFADVLNR